MKNIRSNKKDNRESLRFNCQGMVIFRTMNCDEFWQGMVENFCEDGICVLTSRPMKPGTGIYLRITGQTEIDPAAEIKPRSMAVAEVRRCEKIEDRLSVTYRLGLKYIINP